MRFHIFFLIAVFFSMTFISAWARDPSQARRGKAFCDNLQSGDPDAAADFLNANCDLSKGYSTFQSPLTGNWYVCCVKN